MVSKTNEEALEDLIEAALTGISPTSRQADGGATLGEMQPIYGPYDGYAPGHPEDFDAEYAIDKEYFWHFLEQTQPDQLDKLSSRPNWQRVLLDRLTRKIKKEGVLSVLKKGLSIDDAEFTLFYALPFNHDNPDLWTNFSDNIFSVTRQVHYSQSDPSLSLDMVLFINGIAIATIELKNQWTGQNFTYAKKQYINDRDPAETLLNFGRCLVHFALDTDEVWMTTKLAGEKTFFLPFNKGHNHGKGNPVNISTHKSAVPHLEKQRWDSASVGEQSGAPEKSGGHRSAYLWEEVLQRESLAAIIQHFVLLEGKQTDSLGKKTMIFPRYHQLDVVRRLLAHAQAHGPGERYLIQHSAGSGKSHSITWTAFQLIELYHDQAKIGSSPYQGEAGRGSSFAPKVFDSIIVVTDRRALDKQLSDNIRAFSEVKNVVAHAERSRDLRAALESGKRIVITTIQKFPFIMDEIEDLSDRTFAVIIDEAHSSQGGRAADKMNISLGINLPNTKAGPSGEADEDVNENSDADSGATDAAPEPSLNQDRILSYMAGRKQGPNVSYFAFTATPKNSTLEKFGERQADGSFRPFHLYSMKQAIEEEFIMDVLAKYTTYQSFYEIQKSIQDNPLFDSAKAQKKLRAYVEGNRQTIGVKAEIMVTHFMQNVVAAKKVKGKAKAMIVTRNIRTAIDYYFAVRDLLVAQNAPFKAIVAFSGKKMVKGIEYTEASINGFGGKDIPDKFETDDYRILIVANKFLTGFDQPLLHTMYVDKKLQGLLAVQTLSRLNRANKKMDKTDTFVLDFFNSVEEIKAAFEPFYTATSLTQPTDVNVLHDIKDTLDETGVYEWSEVEAFNELFFANADADQLSPLIDVAAERFIHELDLELDEQIDFKVKAKQFVKIYAQVASIIAFSNVRWEKLHWFLKFLIPKLPVKDPTEDQLTDLLDSIDLSTYGLARVKIEVPIVLDASETEVDPQNPNPRGFHGNDVEQDPLDEIIRMFNERWFEGFANTPEEARVKLIEMGKQLRSTENYKIQVRDNPDDQNSDLAFEKLVDELFYKDRRTGLERYKRYVSDPDFKRIQIRRLKQIVELLDREEEEKAA